MFPSPSRSEDQHLNRSRFAVKRRKGVGLLNQIRRSRNRRCNLLCNL